MKPRSTTQISRPSRQPRRSSLTLLDHGLVVGVPRPHPHAHRDPLAGDREADHDLGQVGPVVLEWPRPGSRARRLRPARARRVRSRSTSCRRTTGRPRGSTGRRRRRTPPPAPPPRCRPRPAGPSPGRPGPHPSPARPGMWTSAEAHSAAASFEHGFERPVGDQREQHPLDIRAEATLAPTPRGDRAVHPEPPPQPVEQPTRHPTAATTTTSRAPRPAASPAHRVGSPSV